MDTQCHQGPRGLCSVGASDSSRPGDQDQHEEMSFPFDVKTVKFAKEIKPVSLKRSILTNANTYLDLEKKKNLTLPTKDRNS